MTKYQKINDTIKGQTVTLAILHVDEVTKTRLSIPLDPDNIDYQEYLEWAKTNTAEAAD